MTIAEKLRFLEERIKDEKEFYVDLVYSWYRFRNSQLMGVGYVGQERTEDCSRLSLNLLLSSPLKLKQQWEFTEDEKVILRNLPDEYRWIARDREDNELYVYTSEPIKTNSQWEYNLGNMTNLNAFKHLFQSIQWSDDVPCGFRKYI